MTHEQLINCLVAIEMAIGTLTERRDFAIKHELESVSYWEKRIDETIVAREALYSDFYGR